jgi:hypothetical protein
VRNLSSSCIGRAEAPRSFGKPLRHSKFGLWRYRLRDYRIICQLQQTAVILSGAKDLNRSLARRKYSAELLLRARSYEALP